ncbi:hypothetical protein D0847_15595 [Bordetella avium]|nr:hypothetical protein D0432_08875 [Bordetella avium]RIQ39095.1 hypothetical protein D0847_15595 [Bordetella avium]RIQ70605.1 hypothetical protein D0838_07480 [Bordetella avium]RIQ80729.1 hypothetical protein D0837_15010 [Bordetella avium]
MVMSLLSDEKTNGIREFPGGKQARTAERRCDRAARNTIAASRFAATGDMRERLEQQQAYTVDCCEDGGQWRAGLPIGAKGAYVACAAIFSRRQRAALRPLP